MRILIVHDYGLPIGGAEILIAQEKTALETRGHVVRLLAGTPLGTPEAFNDLSFKSADTSAWQKLFTYLYNPASASAVRAAVKEFRPDVVHFNTINRASASVLLAAKGIPLVVSLHDYGLFYPRLHRVIPKPDFCGIGDGACCRQHVGRGRYYFETVRTAAHLRLKGRIQFYVAPSRYVSNIAKKLGLSNTIVVPNGVALTQPTGVQGRGLLYVGRLEPEKGIRELIDAMSVVLKDVPTANLVIAGDGSERQKLEDHALAHGLGGHVSFVGHKSLAQIHRLYSDCAVVVMPSLWPEPFGLIGPEAMSAGRPVIAPDRGGIKDWLQNGVNGMSVNPCDKPALASAISELLTDEKLYQKLATGALKSAQKYSIEEHVRQLELVYQHAAKTWQRRYRLGSKLA